MNEAPGYPASYRPLVSKLAAIFGPVVFLAPLVLRT